MVFIVTAQNMTFSNCSSIKTPSLEQSFSLDLYSNYITEFNGAPLLSEVDGGLTIAGNTELTRIALPELRTISGGFTVVDNSKLTALDELYSVERLGGMIDIEGPFETYVSP